MKFQKSFEEVVICATMSPDICTVFAYSYEQEAPLDLRLSLPVGLLPSLLLRTMFEEFVFSLYALPSSA